ncbi:MAG: YggT family protein [Anaerolinea sp.]|nr:YggT family protein [Anaerolinea sp.]
MGGLIAGLITTAFTLLNLLILARVLMGIINPDPYTNQVYRFVYTVTEPILAPVRRRLPQGGMYDFSPIVVIIAAFIAEGILLAFVNAIF